jgi:hypothetical protein
MLRLIKKIILFTLLVLTLISPIALVNKCIINHKLRSNEFKLAANITTLIIGDSHSETSLDPCLIPSSVNVSKSGESIFFTYYKLKYFITQNPGAIHNVILAFSYHNISKKFQEDYLFDDVKSSYPIGCYYKFLDYSGKKKLINFNNINNFIFYSLKNELGFPLMEYKEGSTLKLLFNNNIKRSEIEGFGGFNTYENSDLDQQKINKRIKLYYFDNNKNYTGYSQIMIDSLDSIASLCAKNQIKLHLYNAPLNLAYRRLVPVAAYDNYDKVIKSLRDRYRDVTIFDMSKEPLGDSYFDDGDHVNKSGAIVVSRKLSSQL